MSGDATLYEEVFQITTVIDDKYERVARVIGASQDSLTSLTLDMAAPPKHPQTSMTR